MHEVPVVVGALQADGVLLSLASEGGSLPKLVCMSAFFNGGLQRRAAQQHFWIGNDQFQHVHLHV